MLGGTVQGIAAVPDDEADAYMVVASRYGVQEITTEAYQEAVQKKTLHRHSPITPDLRSPPRPGASLKGHGAVVVDGEKVAQPESVAAKTLPAAIDDAVDLGTAALPVTEPKKSNPKRRSNR